MAKISLQGAPINTNGDLPAIGKQAPEFYLVNSELEDVSLSTYPNKRKLLNIFPSLDTPVCATSTKKFNDSAIERTDVAFLMIAADLPFAMKRFCTAEETAAVIPLSMMRSKAFAEDYGILIIDGPLAGLTARAVIVIDEDNRVIYSELVPEIAQEPDYHAALAALQ